MCSAVISVLRCYCCSEILIISFYLRDFVRSLFGLLEYINDMEECSITMLHSCKIFDNMNAVQCTLDIADIMQLEWTMDEGIVYEGVFIQASTLRSTCVDRWHRRGV